MIISAKEAKELLSSSFYGDRAEGYLECLKGPEVKALVQELEMFHLKKTHRGTGCAACDALAQYREAVKP